MGWAARGQPFIIINELIINKFTQTANMHELMQALAKRLSDETPKGIAKMIYTITITSNEEKELRIVETELRTVKTRTNLTRLHSVKLVPWQEN